MHFCASPRHETKPKKDVGYAYVYLNRGSAKPALDKHKQPTPIAGRERSHPYLKC